MISLSIIYYFFSVGIEVRTHLVAGYVCLVNYHFLFLLIKASTSLTVATNRLFPHGVVITNELLVMSYLIRVVFEI